MQNLLGLKHVNCNPSLIFNETHMRGNMDIDHYQQQANETANHALGDIRRLVACLGLAGEVGEFVDEYKKVIGHGHPINEEKLMKELGDVIWYIAEIATTFGWALSSVLERNIQKLQTRYPEKFTSTSSINRVDEIEKNSN
jgi:NTP pyrophosphatase (non-canonical NTP hydrolase)